MSSSWSKKDIEKLVEYRLKGMTWGAISETFLEVYGKSVSPNCCRKAFYRETRDSKQAKSVANPVKVLVLDIETAPIISYTWGTFQQNVALNQIVEDWAIISWSAKWVGSNQVMYEDTRNEKNPRNDKKILKSIWNLMDEADVIIGQNSKSFDIKKLNARFILNGMKPPSSFRQIDTMRLAKKHFAFTSNKLEYMTKNLCTAKKSAHAKFSGFELWKECLAGNIEAWKELEDYNIQDILATEELYLKLIPWDNSLNFNVYHEEFDNYCSCGSSSFKTKGHVYTNSGKFVRYICNNCGAESRDKTNLLTKEKRKSLRK